MAESIWSDGGLKTKTKTKNQLLGRDQTASRWSAPAQVKERAGRITLFLIVRR